MTQTKKSPRNTDRELGAALVITGVLVSPMIGTFLDGWKMHRQYERYVTNHQKSEGAIISYHEYANNYSKQHPIIGRFYGVGSNRQVNRD